MPKPVHKPTFIPGYICPECEERMPVTSNSARPPVWHEACKPPVGDPRRKKRICPGCGKKRVLEKGESSAYCDRKCKARYIAGFSQVGRGPNTCFCGKPIETGKKFARRYKLCFEHADIFHVITLLRSPDDMREPLYTALEAYDYTTNNLEGMPEKYQRSVRIQHEARKKNAP